MTKLNIKYPATDITNDKLNAMQDGAVKSLGKSRETMQVVLITTLRHIWKHGDRMPASRLIAAIGTTDKADKANRKRIVSFFETFGGLIYEEEGEDFIGWKGKEFIRDNFEIAKGTAWWSFHKPTKREPKAFNINEQIQALIDKATKHKEKGDGNLELKDDIINALLLVCGIDAAISINEAEETEEEELERLLKDSIEADEIAEAIASGDYEEEPACSELRSLSTFMIG